MTISGVTEEPVEHDSAAQPEHQPPALPRRSAQEHLEPQLREERGAGHGTPFAPFTPTEDVDADESDEGGGPTPGAAVFRDGVHRGRRGRHAADDA